ncbi:hypothetical protein ACJMK2_043538, partial [Sinanodonta woodiana]
KMKSIQNTNNYLLESSTANVTTLLLHRGSDKQIQIAEFLKIILFIFLTVFGLIIVTGLVGNILTVAVFWRNKGIKSITDILVLNLAVTDILVIALGFPMSF